MRVLGGPCRYKMYKSSMMDKEKIYYARASFGDTEKQAVMKCLDEFQLSPGKYSDQFEKAVAKLFAKDYGVMVNSGSSALMLVAELLNIKPGDEIVTPGSGFPTTINPFLAKGAKIVFVDINAETLSPNLDEIEKAISVNTKAIVIPHIWGALNDMEALRSIADRYDVPLVEDSCDSIGQTIDGKPSGYWSDISVTSFFPSHVITACGGGGMVIVKRSEEEKRLRVLRDWGRTGTDSEDLEDRFNVNLDGIPYDAKFFYGERGYNLKATEVQAAFGLEQLKKLDNWNDIRRKNYENLFGIVSSFGHAVIKPSAPNCQASWLAFPFLVWGEGERTKLAKYLELNNIQTRPILAGNFTRHPAYKDANYQIIDTLQGCDIVTRHGLGIGLHQYISQDQINYIKKVLEEYK